MHRLWRRKDESVTEVCLLGVHRLHTRNIGIERRWPMQMLWATRDRPAVWLRRQNYNCKNFMQTTSARLHNDKTRSSQSLHGYNRYNAVHRRDSLSAFYMYAVSRSFTVLIYRWLIQRSGHLRWMWNRLFSPVSFCKPYESRTACCECESKLRSAIYENIIFENYWIIHLNTTKRYSQICHLCECDPHFAVCSDILHSCW